MDEVAIVIDNGSGSCKAGFASEEIPKVVLPSVVGYVDPSASINSGQYDYYVGSDAQSKRDVLNISQPIHHGIIQNWDDMETIWKHLFSELDIHPEQRAILMTETSNNSKVNREKLTEVIFEKFRSPLVYVGCQPVLSLYSSGRTSGVEVELGDGVTQIVPIYEGYALPHAQKCFGMGGQVLTNYLFEMLSQKYSPVHTLASCNADVKQIKENSCFVALDFEKESIDPNKGKSYDLPDGQQIYLSFERVKCPEGLFRPSLLGLDAFGIHETTFNCIMSCDSDFHSLKDLYTNIMISGGTAMFSGLEQRLCKEVRALSPYNAPVKVETVPQPLHSAWIGGSVLAGLSSFQSMWITKEEYDDTGPTIVHKKCY